MFLLNWGSKGKRVCSGGIHFCDNCKHITTTEVRVIEKSVGLFFVPVARWDKKFYLVCNVCSAGVPILSEKTGEFIRLVTSGPSDALALKICDRVLHIFVEGDYMSSEEKLNSFPEVTTTLLEKEGYKKEHIENIIPVFLKNFAHTLDKA